VRPTRSGQKLTRPDGEIRAGRVDRRRGSGDVSADQGAVIPGLSGRVRLLVSPTRQKVQDHTSPLYAQSFPLDGMERSTTRTLRVVHPVPASTIKAERWQGPLHDLSKARRSTVITNLTLIYAMVKYSVGRREAAMDQDRSEIAEQVVKFPPKQQSGNPADEAGQAVIAQIRKAAQLANENCDRAMALAHKLAMQLRAAEDRITELEAEVTLVRDRATRAEGWLQTIHGRSELHRKLMRQRHGAVAVFIR
jgi:hypothetical protein